MKIITIIEDNRITGVTYGEKEIDEKEINLKEEHIKANYYKIQHKRIQLQSKIYKNTRHK